MVFSIDKKPRELEKLKKRMRALAVESPIVEPPMTPGIAGLFADINAGIRRNKRLEEATGLKIAGSSFRTSLKSRSGLPSPPEYLRTLYNDHEVGVALELFKRYEIILGLDFPSTEKTDVVHASSAILEYNRSSQLVMCTLKRAHEMFPLENKHRFEIEKGKGRWVSFGYDVHTDMASLTFSASVPDCFEEHPHVHGAIALYSGTEPVGYEMVEFSEFYNSSCRVPHLKVPR